MSATPNLGPAIPSKTRPNEMRYGDGTFDEPLWGNETGVVIGYMDKVDFDYELGGALGGNKVFPSIADLAKHKPCSAECGIVEVEIRLKRVVQAGTI